MLYLLTMVKKLVFVLFSFVLLVVFWPRESCVVSDHCDGERFYNPAFGPLRQKKFLNFLKWQLARDKTPWPKFLQSSLVQFPEVGVHFINHATVLVKLGNVTIITDPVFSDGVGPLFPFVKRHRDPGLSLEKIEKVDVIVISHNHYDHLDLKSLEAIYERFSPKLIVPLGVKVYLPKQLQPFAHEMDWWQRLEYQGVEFHLVPAQHWSKRTPFDTNRSLWGGYVMKHQNKHVFFAGDTGYGDHFKKIRQTFGPMDVSLLPIGAYEPRWFMEMAHMNPQDALKAHMDLESKWSLGIHFGTFQLADEGIEDPLRDLEKAKKNFKGFKGEFVVPYL